MNEIASNSWRKNYKILMKSYPFKREKIGWKMMEIEKKKKRKSRDEEKILEIDDNYRDKIPEIDTTFHKTLNGCC